LVRHAPSINGRVQGSVRQLMGEDITLNGGATISGDLLVPGTPTVRTNGHPQFGGVVTGSGNTLPNKYQVTLNGNAVLNHLVNRTDPIDMPVVTTPPQSTGTLDLVINSTNQIPTDFSNVRDITINSNVGTVRVPAGTYRNIIVNSHSSMVIGTANAN